MSGDDPWDWSIDRVIKELCTTDRTWHHHGSLAALPISMDLAGKLREECIDGYVLLCKVTDEFMKQDLGLTKLGWRAFVSGAFEQLRLRSEKYRQHAGGLHTFNFPLAQHQFQPIDPSSAHHNLPLQTKSAADEFTFHDRSTSGEFLVSDSLSNKKRKLDLTDTTSNLGVQNQDEALFAAEPENSESLQARDAISAPHVEFTEKNGQKRKRMVPTLITSVPNRDISRAIPTAADNVVQNQPGMAIQDQKSDRRFLPIHQPDDVSKEPYGFKTMQGGEDLLSMEVAPLIASHAVQATESETLGYLGEGKMTVDNIFYNAIPVGHNLPDNDDVDATFLVVPKTIASGRRLYMYHITKRYLSSQRLNLVRDGQMFSAIQPYKLKLIEENCHPSFTLFSAAQDGSIQARREEVRNWPEIDQARLRIETVADGRDVKLYPSLPGTPKNIGSSESLKSDSLRKRQGIEVVDKVMPLYGESDEDNEYDSDTLMEIEAEQASIAKLPKASSTQLLAIEVVYRVIDDVIAEMILMWRDRKLPAKQHRAYAIWKKFRSTRTRREQLELKRMDFEHLDRRVSELRDEIATLQWSSKEKVRAMASVLEPTIYRREEMAWEIEVIESDQQPQKTLQLPSWKTSLKKSQADNGDDSESISSDTSVSEVALDGFIVDDNPASDELVEYDFEYDYAAEGDDEDGIAEIDPPDICLEAHAAQQPRLTASTKTTVPEVNGKDINEHLPDLLEDESPDLPIITKGVRFDEKSLDRLESNEINHSSSQTSRISVKHKGPSLAQAAGTSSNNAGTMMYDLTISSDEPDSNVMHGGKMVHDLITPPKKKPSIRLINRNSPILISDGEDSSNSPDPTHLPALDDAAAIAKYSHRHWVKLADPERLVISVLQTFPVPLRNRLFALTAATEDDLWQNMLGVMRTIRKGEDNIKGMDGATFETFNRLIRLFMIFVDCQYYQLLRRPNKVDVTGVRNQPDKFAKFYTFCKKIEGYFESQTSVLSTPLKSAKNRDEEDEEPHNGHRRRSRPVNASDEDESREDTPTKIKRRNVIHENEAARQLREQDQERRAAQEERRKNLLAHHPKSQELSNQSQIIVNASKLDDQGFVYFNEKIGRRIKDHQVDGVRFMWDQLVADGAKQGCLLAHTMGLGKTMQVITLLVAIAEATLSPDESVSAQIPLNLRESKTLILCPPTLIDNWMDELLIWAPTDSLGPLRKIDTTLKNLDERRNTIDDWYKGGGILILGYEMFRILIENKKRSNHEAPPLDDWSHAQVKMQLTEGPNIIVADEAHKLKNPSSGLATTTSLLRSRSRIALTGSPLANNLEEYHTMIEWIAPNYLGPIAEFRAKYVVPITTGLYFESEPYQRRKSLKMLGVLKEDIAPKVHRADISVLRNDLPPKKEFLIVVPLTEPQRNAYSLYVKSMLSSSVPHTKDGAIVTTTLWSWLATMSLLCNHPYAFMTKLKERYSKSNHRSPSVSGEGTTDQDDSALEAVSAASNMTVGNFESLVNEAERIFAPYEQNKKSVNLSYKTKLLCQILDASKAAGDKALVFSMSIPTINFLEDMCVKQGRKYARLDGKTKMEKRQAHTKQFNSGSLELYLISTSAGSLGLNLYGANRVVIFDFKFNPILEEQAIGRAYRIGQLKEVFVYRLVAGGTFEDLVQNTAIFKTQLAARVVDKKNPIRQGRKKPGDYLFDPKVVEKQDLTKFKGVDPAVLDQILASQNTENFIRDIVQTDTFEKDDEDILTPEEELEVQRFRTEEALRRRDPQAYRMAQRSDVSVPEHPSNSGMKFKAPARNMASISNPRESLPRSISAPIRSFTTILNPTGVIPRLTHGQIQSPPRAIIPSSETASTAQNPTTGDPKPARARLGFDGAEGSTPSELPIRPSPTPETRPIRSTFARSTSEKSWPVSLDHAVIHFPDELQRSAAESLPPYTLQTLPDLPASKFSTARRPLSQQRQHKPRPAQTGRLSPIMGAGTRKMSFSDVLHPNSPPSMLARSTKPSTEPAKPATEHQNGDMNDQDKVTPDDDMFLAMSKRPSAVQSLRTPVTKISPTRKLDGIRAKRAVQQTPTRQVSKTSSHSTPEETEPRLPHWMERNVMAMQQGSRFGRDSSTSSRNTTPKD